jgi:hypothetical protein
MHAEGRNNNAVDGAANTTDRTTTVSVQRTPKTMASHSTRKLTFTEIFDRTMALLDGEARRKFHAFDLARPCWMVERCIHCGGTGGLHTGECREILVRESQYQNLIQQCLEAL